LPKEYGMALSAYRDNVEAFITQKGNILSFWFVFKNNVSCVARLSTFAFTGMVEN